MLKKVKIKIETDRLFVKNSLFEQYSMPGSLTEATMMIMLDPPKPLDEEEMPEHVDMHFLGRLRLSEDSYSLTYRETFQTGMEGSVTQLQFQLQHPQMLTLTRSGTVQTAMVFEEGKRYRCSYDTPFMPFEIGIYTRGVENRLVEDGILRLDYVVEIRGAQAEHCVMQVMVKDEGEEMEDIPPFPPKK